MLALKPGEALTLEPGIVLHSVPDQDRYYAFSVITGDQFRLNQTSFWVLEAINQSMGHANIGITLDTYSHLLPGMGKTAAERLDRLLGPWVGSEDVGKMSAKGNDPDTRLEGFEPTTLGSEDRCSIR